MGSALTTVLLPLALALVMFGLGLSLTVDDFARVGLQFGKTLQVFAVVLVPVALGMLVRQRATGFADRMDKPVRIASAVVLALVILGTIIAERENITGYISDVGLPALLFCLASLTPGFLVPRLFGVVRRQAIASAFEIGVHNGTLAIAIAISVLDSVELAVPAAVYSVIMFPAAAVFGWAITRSAQHRDVEEAPVRT